MKRKIAKPASSITMWMYGLLILLGGVLLGKYVFVTKPLETGFMETSQVRDLADFVERAAMLVEDQGEEAYSAFRVQDGQWWQGDNYIFVYDINGNTLVLPPTPEEEDTNRLMLADSNGTRYVNEMVQALKNKDSAWVEYSYPKPGEVEASQKLAFVRKVKLESGKYVFVGSGIYY